MFKIQLHCLQTFFFIFYLITQGILPNTYFFFLILHCRVLLMKALAMFIRYHPAIFWKVIQMTWSELFHTKSLYTSSIFSTCSLEFWEQCFSKTCRHTFLNAEDRILSNVPFIKHFIYIYISHNPLFSSENVVLK